LFGGVTVMQLHAQGFGIDVPSEFLSMLPYAAYRDRAGHYLSRPEYDSAEPAGFVGGSFHPDA